MLDKMKAEKRNCNAIYLEFIESKNRLIGDGINIFFFIEGKDDINYYESRFIKYFEHNYKYYQTQGRENVLKLRNKLKKNAETSRIKLAFFIDKDFENDCCCSDLYITPCYSIENLYISRNVFKLLLERHFASEYSSENKEFNKLYNLYIKRKEEFLVALDELMEFYFYNVKLKNDMSKFTELNSKIISISLEKIEKKYDINKLKKDYSIPKEKLTDELKKEFENIKKDKIKFYRGKFLFYFLKEFLKKLREDCNSRDPIYCSLGKKCNINTSNLLFELANCSETPKKLDEFLTQIKNCG